MYSFIGLSVKIESIFFSFFFDSDLSKSDSTFHIWINPTKTIVQICQIFISTILISSLQEYFVTHENPNFSFDLSEIFRISVRGKLYFDILPDSDHLFIFLCATSEESAVPFFDRPEWKNVKRSENCQPIVRTCHLLWKSGNRSFLGLKFFPTFNEGMEECGRGRRKSTPYVLGVALIEVCLPSENQDRPDASVSPRPLFHYARRVSTVE